MLEEVVLNPRYTSESSRGPLKLQAHLTLLKPDRVSYNLKIPAHDTALPSMLNKHNVLCVANYLS